MILTHRHVGGLDDTAPYTVTWPIYPQGRPPEQWVNCTDYRFKEAGQRIRATQSLMRSQGMTDGENHRDLLTRLSTALAMTEAAYLEARRRRDL
jgi:hypothetical protein